MHGCAEEVDYAAKPNRDGQQGQKAQHRRHGRRVWKRRQDAHAGGVITHVLSVTWRRGSVVVIATHGHAHRHWPRIDQRCDASGVTGPSRSSQLSRQLRLR
eukprot:4676511-Prymnesium_polylepis.2